MNNIKKGNGLMEYFESRGTTSDLYSILFDTLPEFKYITGFLMFNFNMIFLRQGLNPDVSRPKNFDILIRKIRKLITEYKKLI